MSSDIRLQDIENPNNEFGDLSDCTKAFNISVLKLF